MAVTISKDKYPTLSAETGVSGKRKVIYINYGENATEAAPVWTKLGGLTSQTTNWNAAASTQNTKDTGYWASGAVTSKSFDLSCDVMFKRDDEGQAVIDNFMLDDTITATKGALMLLIVDLDAKTGEKIKVIPTKWTEKAEAKDVITKTLTATGISSPKIIKLKVDETAGTITEDTTTA
nr:MAG TPA: tail tube protein [Bacteriophage sp.]